MDGHTYVSRQRAHLDGQHTFSDQFSSARADDADTEHALSFGINEQFGETFGTIDGGGASGSGPWKFRDGDFAPLFIGLRLGQSSPGDFGIGEDNGGNRIRFEGDFVAGDGFDGGASFMHGFVREHRFSGDVADGVNCRIGSLPLPVDFDESLLIDFDLRFVEAGDFGVWTASHRHQHTIEDLLFFFYVRTFESYSDAGLFVFQRFDGGVEENRGEKFFETLMQRKDQVAVGSGSKPGIISTHVTLVPSVA